MTEEIDAIFSANRERAAEIAGKARRRRVGLEQYRADPRRAEAVPIAVIIAAWRRGWNQFQIAFASGVSHQRINQRIVNYEKRHGPVWRAERPIQIKVLKFPWRCAHCDKLEWSTRIRLRKGEVHFCSWRCQAASLRVVTDQQIEQAIYLRWEGNSWSHIAKLIGYSQQTLQTRIWKYLYATGQLNRGVVESIWIEGHLEQTRVGWSWLELNTGIYCTEHGAEEGFRRGKKKPWGKRFTGPDGFKIQ